MQVQQHTEDAGNACAGRAQADNRGIQRAARAADRTGDERPEETQVDAKIAGSVMPMNAESEAGSAMDLSFLFLVLSATASAAPPCATFAAEASGSQ